MKINKDYINHESLNFLSNNWKLENNELSFFKDVKSLDITTHFKTLIYDSYLGVEEYNKNNPSLRTSTNLNARGLFLYQSSSEEMFVTNITKDTILFKSTDKTNNFDIYNLSVSRYGMSYKANSFNEAVILQDSFDLTPGNFKITTDSGATYLEMNSAVFSVINRNVYCQYNPGGITLNIDNSGMGVKTSHSYTTSTLYGYITNGPKHQLVITSSGSSSSDTIIPSCGPGITYKCLFNSSDVNNYFIDYQVGVNNLFYRCRTGEVVYGNSGTEIVSHFNLANFMMTLSNSSSDYIKNTNLTLQNQQLTFSTSYYLDGTSSSNVITNINAELSPLYYMNSGQHKVLSTYGNIETIGNGGQTLGIMSSSVNLYRYSDNRLSLYGSYTSYQDGQECWNLSGGATYGMSYDSKGYNHIVKNNGNIVYNVSSTDYNYSVYQMARSTITVNSTPNYYEYLANPRMYVSIWPGVDDPAYLFYKGNAYDYSSIFSQDLRDYSTDFWYQRYLGKIYYSLSGTELLMKAQDITIPNVTQLEGQKFGGELSISPITGIKYYFGLYTDGSSKQFDETYSLELIPNRIRARKDIKTEIGSSYYYPLDIRLGTSGSSLYIRSDDNKGFQISDSEFSSYFNSDDLTYKYSFGEYGFELSNHEVQNGVVQCNSLLKYTDWNKYSGIIHKDEMEFYLENNAPLLGHGLKSTLTFSGSNVINDPSTGPNMTWRTQTNVNYFEEGCNITNYNLSNIQFESVFNNKYKQIRLSTKLIDLNNIHEYIPGLSIENIDKNNNNYGTLITVYSDKITFRNEQRTATTGSYSDNTTIIEQTYLQYRPSDRYVSTTMPEGYKMDGNTWIINADGTAQFEDIQIKKSDGTFVSLRDIIF